MLAEAVVNKLFDSLPVVKAKKTCLHWELGEGRGTGRNSPGQGEEKVETLGNTLAKVEAKVLVDTQGEKLKEVQLEILETQWPM